jgi:hypothetical protein
VAYLQVEYDVNSESVYRVILLKLKSDISYIKFFRLMLSAFPCVA